MTTHLSTGEVEDVDLYLHTPYAFRACKRGVNVTHFVSEYLTYKKFKVQMILQIIRLEKLVAVVVWHAVNFL